MTVHKYEVATKDAIRKLQEALTDYAAHRKTADRVGQFLDEEGCRDAQFGIYGIASWLIMTAAIEHITVVHDMRLVCKDSLKQWVQDSKSAGTTEKHAYELSSIIPKIAFAFEALSLFSDAHDEAGILQSRLATAQHLDGGWGFLPNSPDSNPFVTALVLRSIESQPAFANARKEAVRYLKASIQPNPNLYENLYVLNALQRVNEKENISDDIKKRIKNTIRKIFRQVRMNPTAFPNPVNVDFHDSGRTRYFRFQTDLVLLEALLLMSGGAGIYLRAHAGRRLFNSVTDNLSSQRFNTDTSGHRASVGAYLFTWRTLIEIQRRIRSKTPDSLLAIGAWIACASAFGVNFTWSVVALTVAAAGASIAHQFGWTSILGACIGAGIKTLIDAFRSLWITYVGGDE